LTSEFAAPKKHNTNPTAVKLYVGLHRGYNQKQNLIYYKDK